MQVSRFWPANVPCKATPPEQPLHYFLNHNARCYPSKAAIVFCENSFSYSEIKKYVDQLAVFIKNKATFSKGDRVLLMGQNSPQFIIAYYAILKAGGVVVPVNVMSKTSEIEYLVNDSEASFAIVAREVYEAVQKIQNNLLKDIIVFNYKDILKNQDVKLPSILSLEHSALNFDNGLYDFNQIINGSIKVPLDLGEDVSVDDMCLLPYTSGTTGFPKGCVHTHRTMLASLYSASIWRNLHSETVVLCAAPLFHLLGMQNNMNTPMFLGGTTVMLPRWDIESAAQLIERYQVTTWSGTPSMFIDFFNSPKIKDYNLSSLSLLTGGGAVIPSSLIKKFKEKYQLIFVEGYGMTETASFLHSVPLGRMEGSCLGLETQGVTSLVIDPATLEEVPVGEVGELATHGAQIMLRYWKNDQANEESFFERDGKRFLRTGDLVRKDDDGLFYMCDRLKRMVNVSGFKVWPSEVENMLYSHPAVQEVCIIGLNDAKKGERVKALIVLKNDYLSSVNEEEIIQWCREQMANYKVPKEVEFVTQLPKSGTGKILWRQLQDEQNLTT